MTAGIGVEALAERFKREHDDYSAILVKSVADRLAEAFAEMLQQRVRRARYAPGESLSAEDLVAEKCRRIRQAFGYPPCPDHVLKGTLCGLLDAETQDLPTPRPTGTGERAATRSIHGAFR